MEGLGEGQQIVSGELGKLTEVAFRCVLKNAQEVVGNDGESLYKGFAKECQALQPGIVRLHGGQRPLMEAKRHWYGNAGGTSSCGSSLMPDFKKHHRALMQAAAGIPLPGKAMEENDVLLSSFGSLAY